MTMHAGGAPWLAVVVWLIMAGAASAQHPPRLTDAFDGPALAALEREVQAAAAVGLPTEPLVLKALEGWSKGAADAPILNAVRALRHRLAAADSALDHRWDEDVLAAAAAALYLGVDRHTLTTLHRRTHPEALGMAYVVVGDLVRRGVPVAQAARAVVSLGAAGADAEAFSEFRRKVYDDIKTGARPDRATDVRLRGALSRLPGGGPP